MSNRRTDTRSRGCIRLQRPNYGLSDCGKLLGLDRTPKGILGTIWRTDSQRCTSLHWSKVRGTLAACRFLQPGNKGSAHIETQFHRSLPGSKRLDRSAARRSSSLLDIGFHRTGARWCTTHPRLCVLYKPESQNSTSSRCMLNYLSTSRLQPPSARRRPKIRLSNSTHRDRIHCDTSIESPARPFWRTVACGNRR